MEYSEFESRAKADIPRLTRRAKWIDVRWAVTVGSFAIFIVLSGIQKPGMSDLEGFLTFTLPALLLAFLMGYLWLWRQYPTVRDYLAFTIFALGEKIDNTQFQSDARLHTRELLRVANGIKQNELQSPFPFKEKELLFDKLGELAAKYRARWHHQKSTKSAVAKTHDGPALKMLAYQIYTNYTNAASAIDTLLAEYKDIPPIPSLRERTKRFFASPYVWFGSLLLAFLLLGLVPPTQPYGMIAQGLSEKGTVFVIIAFLSWVTVKRFSTKA